MAGDSMEQDEDIFTEFKHIQTSSNMNQQQFNRVQRTIGAIAARYSTSFLNARGGKIYFGVADDATIVGMHLDQARRDLLSRSICAYWKACVAKLGDANPMADLITVEFLRLAGPGDLYVVKVQATVPNHAIGTPRPLYSVNMLLDDGTPTSSTWVRQPGETVLMTADGMKARGCRNPLLLAEQQAFLDMNAPARSLFLHAATTLDTTHFYLFRQRPKSSAKDQAAPTAQAVGPVGGADFSATGKKVSLFVGGACEQDWPELNNYLARYGSCSTPSFYSKDSGCFAFVQMIVPPGRALSWETADGRGQKLHLSTGGSVVITLDKGSGKGGGKGGKGRSKGIGKGSSKGGKGGKGGSKGGYL
jgi:hypothetical protein